jgi:hypothetical protein
MQTWAWRAVVSPDDVKARVLSVLADRGFAPAKAKGSVHVSIYSDGDKGTLVLGWSPGGFAIAEALCRAFNVAATYSEVELADKKIAATSRKFGKDGNAGAVKDHADEAEELCETWFEGKKYRPECADDLVAIFVGVDDGCPKTGTDLAFDRVGGNARVQALVDAVRAGATWEKTTIGGRKAVRIKDAAGAIRTSVLDDAEFALFERDIA